MLPNQGDHRASVGRCYLVVWCQAYAAPPSLGLGVTTFKVIGNLPGQGGPAAQPLGGFCKTFNPLYERIPVLDYCTSVGKDGMGSGLPSGLLSYPEL